jgi:Ni/Co efflux regulator RcnB
MVKIHQVVCETYHGPRPDGLEVAHADGDPANNAAANLRWSTPSGNSADRARHGTVARGETHGLHRFTEAQVIAMREACASGESYSSVARRFATHRMTVRDIALRKRWAHI